MKSDTLLEPTWSTAAFAEPKLNAAWERSSLGAHLDLCRITNSRMFALRCAAESMNGFVMSRFITTLVVLTLFIGAVSMFV